MVENKDYIRLSEAQLEMKENLLLKCSVCGDLNIQFIHFRFPKEVEEFIEQNDYLNEEALLDAASYKYIAEFQDIESYNFENEVPSFLCEVCIED